MLNILADVCQINGKNVPEEITTIIQLVINLIKIGVPILLVIFGMLDLGKAVVAQKEDEIKKAQQTFMKRIITAAIVFLVIFIVQLVVSLVAGDGNLWDEIACFIGAK